MVDEHSPRKPVNWTVLEAFYFVYKNLMETGTLDSSSWQYRYLAAGYLRGRLRNNSGPTDPVLFAAYTDIRRYRGVHAGLIEHLRSEGYHEFFYFPLPEHGKMDICLRWSRHSKWHLDEPVDGHLSLVDPAGDVSEVIRQMLVGAPQANIMFNGTHCLLSQASYSDLPPQATHDVFTEQHFSALQTMALSPISR